MEGQPKEAIKDGEDDDDEEACLDAAISKVLQIKFRPPFSHPLRKQMWEERKQLYEAISLEKQKFFRSRKVTNDEKNAFKMKNLNAWIKLYSQQKALLQEESE